MYRARIVRSLPAAALAALSLSACTGSSSTSPPDPGDPLQRGVEPVLLTQSERMEVQMEALFDGEVVMDGEGCLRLGSAIGSTVIWPVGTTLEKTGGDVVVLDEAGDAIGVVGARFRLGGGVIPDFSADVPVDGRTRAQAVASCPGTYWLVGAIPGR